MQSNPMQPRNDAGRAQPQTSLSTIWPNNIMSLFGYSSVEGNSYAKKRKKTRSVLHCTARHDRTCTYESIHTTYDAVVGRMVIGETQGVSFFLQNKLFLVIVFINFDNDSDFTVLLRFVLFLQYRHTPNPISLVLRFTPSLWQPYATKCCTAPAVCIPR